MIRRREPAPKLRKVWGLKPGSVFLNHGSFGACPLAILGHQTELRRQMEAEPVQFLWRHYEERLEASRAVVAQFVGARTRDLVFVTNATTAVNAVLRSVAIRPGDEILTTDHDYNACRNVLAETARLCRVEVVVAPVPFPLKSPDQIIESILSRVTRRTRLAMIDHVTSTTAVIFPVAEIIRELDRRGVDTLIDGSHAPGMLPLHLGRLAPAFYTGNLHKWVCAPKGCGFLWAREDKQDRLHPAVVSHGHNTPRPGFSPFQDRFDWAGTFDPTAWFCAGPAIHFLQKLVPGGWSEIRQRNHQLVVQARQLLCERLEIEPPCSDGSLGSMATIELPTRFQGRARLGKIDPEQLLLYDRHGIEVPFFRRGQDPETRYLRISAHLYNTPSDYECLATALAAL
jgi:isopenicillin-N epimerase